MREDAVDEDQPSAVSVMNFVWDTHVPQDIILAVAILAAAWLVYRTVSRRIGRMICVRKGHKRRGWRRSKQGYAGYCGRCGQRLKKAHRHDAWEEAH